MRISDWSSDVCSSDLFTLDVLAGARLAQPTTGLVANVIGAEELLGIVVEITAPVAFKLTPGCLWLAVHLREVQPSLPRRGTLVGLIGSAFYGGNLLRPPRAILERADEAEIGRAHV